MIPLSQTCKILPLIALICVSCVTYRNVPVSERGFPVESDNNGVKYEHTGPCTRADRYRAIIIRHLAKINALTPASKINNRGVELALKGSYPEAEMLFRELARLDGADGAVYNNLGVVCELQGNRKKAVELYGKACVLEQGNRRFRSNFRLSAGSGHE